MKWAVRIGLILAILVTALAAGVVVSAQETDVVSTTHVLRAQGDGFTALHGSGVVDLTGNGILWVRGAESIEIHGDGSKKDFGDGWVEFYGFHGQAHVVGRNMTILLAGESLTLDAVGRGTAFLWGQGTYAIDRGPYRPWPTYFRPIRF